MRRCVKARLCYPFFMDLVSILKKGGIGVMPTDTLYGLVGSALVPETVERIYAVRKRDEGKPMIILISSQDDLKKFDVTINEEEKKILEKIWPAKVSVILSCPSEKFSYLHRGTKTLAFRFPNDKKLQALLKETGPLVAPSANPQGQEPARTIEEAKKYFVGSTDFYEDGGTLDSLPSTLVSLKGGKLEVIREGAVNIQK